MILEDAKFRRKGLTMVDVDFSKAYDSTEQFVKDISLRSTPGTFLVLGKKSPQAAKHKRA